MPDYSGSGTSFAAARWIAANSGYVPSQSKNGFWRVDNLNDSGPGSLRAAVEAEGPRIVVFRVGGSIALNTRLPIRHPFLTLDAQNAPGEGILIRNHGIDVRTHDRCGSSLFPYPPGR